MQMPPPGERLDSSTKNFSEFANLEIPNDHGPKKSDRVIKICKKLGSLGFKATTESPNK